MKDIADWRIKIDAIDQQLLKLLNERAKCALGVGHIKRAKNLPIYDPAREKLILEKLESKNPGPLSEAAVKRLFERIIDESRLLEKHASLGLGDDQSRNGNRE